MLTCVEEGFQILNLTIEDLKVTKVQTAMLEYLSLRFSITNHINISRISPVDAEMSVFECVYHVKFAI